LAWLGGWWIPIVAPMLGLTGSIAAITAFNARNASEIRKIFGRYLNDEVVANLLESQEGLKMGGERRKITLLTSDLRGFTARSDSLSPEYVVKIMNLYFEQMAEIITKHKGVIDEYMGDSILVLFGAPSKREDDAERAIACALEMQIGINKVNEKLKEWKVPALEMGIGINTGEVVVGNIGSEKRTKYGVIGGQVNLTYRIESFTIGGQIFISESTIQELDQKNLRIDNQKKIEAKGVKEPISIYQIGGITGEYNLFLPKQEQEEFYSLSQPISFEYQVLDEKLIIKNKSKGQLLKISSSGAIIKTEGHTLKVFSNLKIKISIDGNEEEIYAKIISLVKSETFYINFTYIGKIYKTLIKRVINQQ
jgi:adenylate cyclase